MGLLRRIASDTLRWRAPEPAGEVLRVVIVGANFAGLAAALALPGRYRVTVIDPSPDFEFLPNIHELLSRTKGADDLRLSKPALLRRMGHEFVDQPVMELDPERRHVVTASGRRLDYDLCLVAIGAEDNTRGVPGADTLAMPFKSVSQCAAIEDRLAGMMARVDPGAVTIVGGGLEGVEALGEILRRYRDHPRLQVHVVEGGDRLMPDAPAALDGHLRDHCRKLPVAIHTGRRVARIEPGRVLLDSGEGLPCGLTIWTAGIRPPDLLHRWGLARGAGCWAQVQESLLAAGRRDLFVVGDAAEFPRPLARQAYHALDMGAHAAANIRRMAYGLPAEPFRPAPKPMLISFGDLDMFLVRGRTVLAGNGLAPLKEAVFQYSMARMDPPTGARTLRDLAGRVRLSLPGWPAGELSLARFVRRVGVRVISR